MASCPNLNEEDETEQNGYLVGSSEVGSKQVVRQRGSVGKGTTLTREIKEENR